MTVRLDNLEEKLKRTKIDEVAFKGVLELRTVELEHAPVFGKAFGTDVEGEGGGGADVANDALFGRAPLPLNLVIEFLEVLD